ncbi:MAG: RNA polymerase sigma factor [Exilibacterium sp.]
MEFKYRSIVNTHSRQVYGLALRILNNRAEAEDCTQEVFERLWKQIGKVEQVRAGAWLSQVTRNCAIDYLRQRHVTQEYDDSHEADVSDSPSCKLQNSQLGHWLRSAIGKLKEPYRSIILRSDLHEQSQREIAEYCELNENQVKVYLHRARKQLRAILQGGE